MRQSPQLDESQKRMAPGVISAHGFLGEDTRRLAAILDDDEARVGRQGVTHADMARRMAELRDAGAPALGEFADVAPHFEVRVESVRGKLPCPFGDQCLTQKGFTVVRNASTGREITFTDLSIHMIEAHGFYGGRGASFRLDPERLVEILEVLPAEPV